MSGLLRNSGLGDLTIGSTSSSLPQFLEKQLENHTCAEVRDGELISHISKYIVQTASTFAIKSKQSSSDDETRYWFERYFGGDTNPQGPELKSGERTDLFCGWGWHQTQFEDKTIKVFIQALGNPVGTNSCAKIYETMVLLVEGKNQQLVLKRFCDHVILASEETKDKFFNIYRWSVDYSYWTKATTKIARPLESIILPSAVKESLIQDIDDFLSPETFKWYKIHGIPYKRSFLLYGPPGSGKSSVIQAIAGYYQRNVCYIQPLNPKFTDDSFTQSIQSAPQSALIVIEDIDAYFGVDREALHSNCPFSFSGRLNGLDGVGSTDGQIFILTTNFIDKLDSALIRSGRVDRKIEFPMVNPELAEEMFLQYYPKEVEAAKFFRSSIEKELADKPDLKLCMADLQQHFIANRKNDPQTAAGNISDVTGLEFKLLTERALKLVKKEAEKEGDKDEEEGVGKSESSSWEVGKGALAGLGVSFGIALGFTVYHLLTNK